MNAEQRAREGKLPSQIRYIIGNEAAERFSYYGMRSILVIFMTQYLLLEESQSKGVYHYFAFANYFVPIFGAWLADRFLGKYKTILYLSLFYCVGHGILAAFESKLGLYWGLAFIALGSGGIKPCVSALVGDQFDHTTQHLLKRVYSIFYFS
ncbi:MAG: MFS transporter, partial [Proteobacteria bacterium]|nr:MFS transporter [Pseudomonadota bacterium]NDD05130.1 MFS transporter [Pseudomonadota bacterium]